MAENRLYGLLAEFPNPDALVTAAGEVHKQGYTRIDALTPFPIEGLAEVMGYHDRRIQKMILARRHHRLSRRAGPAAARQPARRRT